VQDVSPEPEVAGSITASPSIRKSRAWMINSGPFCLEEIVVPTTQPKFTARPSHLMTGNSVAPCVPEKISCEADLIFESGRGTATQRPGQATSMIIPTGITVPASVL
jgi:hypothetical protein